MTVQDGGESSGKVKKAGAPKSITDVTKLLFRLRARDRSRPECDN